MTRSVRNLYLTNSCKENIIKIIIKIKDRQSTIQGEAVKDTCTRTSNQRYKHKQSKIQGQAIKDTRNTRNAY